MLRLFGKSSVDTDSEIHQYTEDIKDLVELIKDTSLDIDQREQLEYSLKVMILIQQRLMENR